MIWGPGGPVRLPDGMFGPGAGPGSGLGRRTRTRTARPRRDAVPVPMVWAPAVREAVGGPPFAVVVVEIGGRLHPAFAGAAPASGFAPAAGEPPDTDAVVETCEGVPVRLRLVGGEVWEPVSEVLVSAGRLSAAAGRQAVVVIVVPPGTWPSDLADPDPGRAAQAFTRSLQAARAAGLVLHGTATLAPAGAGAG